MSFLTLDDINSTLFNNQGCYWHTIDLGDITEGTEDLNEVKIDFCKVTRTKTESGYEFFVKVDNSNWIGHDYSLSSSQFVSAPIKRNGGLYSPIRSRKKDNSAHLSSKYYSEDAAIILDDYFIMESWNRATTGPYEGGVDNTIAWNNNFFELVPYELPQCNDPDGIYYFTSTSELGFEIPSKEIIVYIMVFIKPILQTV